MRVFGLGPTELIILFVIVGVPLIAIVMSSQKNGGGGTASNSTFFSPQSPEDVVNCAMQSIVRNGGSITSSTPTMVSAQFVKRGSCLITLILALFFIFPAVLYFLWAKRSYQFLVQASVGPEGKTTVNVTSSGGPAAKAASDFMSSVVVSPS